MSTRSGIDAAINSRLDDDNQHLACAVKAEFNTDDVRLWSGIDDITIDSEAYTGAGTLLTLSETEDTSELKSTNLVVSLSGMDTTVMNYALTDNYQNRPLTLYMIFVYASTNEVVGKMTLFKGRMTSISIKDDPNGSIITVNAENRLIDLNRPSNLRYTNESQIHVATGDTSFRYVQQMQDIEVIWGQHGQHGSAGMGDPMPHDDIWPPEDREQ